MIKYNILLQRTVKRVTLVAKESKCLATHTTAELKRYIHDNCASVKGRPTIAVKRNYKMKKIIAIVILTTFFSCTPYQRMFLAPANLSTFIDDSCDVNVISHLKQVIDTTEFWWRIHDPAILLEDVRPDPSCEYHSKKLISPLHKDSTIWLLTIRPVQVGKDEITLGNLYTFNPNQDSIFIFERRVKKYSQNDDFESGKYLVFTYYVEDDTTTVVKTGSRMY